MRLQHRVPLLTMLILGLGAAVAAEPVTKEVEVNGFTMSYVEDGSGEPIVFVHGAAMDARAWDPIREEIADGHRFVAPTLRYFGTGAWPDGGQNFGEATHADDVVAFIEALGLGPVHLVGRSYGGNVAVAAALKNPGLVRTLIVWEPPLPAGFIQPGETGDAARESAGRMFGPVDAAVEEGDAKKATRLLVEGLYQLPPGGFEALPQWVQEMQLDNAHTTALLWARPYWGLTCEMLEQFDKPVLVAHGGNSDAFFSHLVESMGECLPQAEVAVLPGVNHGGPIQDPAGFAKLVEDFVASH